MAKTVFDVPQAIGNSSLRKSICDSPIMETRCFCVRGVCIGQDNEKMEIQRAKFVFGSFSES